MKESQSNGVSGKSSYLKKPKNKNIYVTKVIASWALFIGVFIPVLDMLLQNVDIPETIPQSLRRKFWKLLPVPVHPFLFVHDPKDMKQLMKEATTACMCQINAIFKKVLKRYWVQSI